MGKHLSRCQDMPALMLVVSFSMFLLSFTSFMLVRSSALGGSIYASGASVKAISSISDPVPELAVQIGGLLALVSLAGLCKLSGRLLQGRMVQ